MLRWLGAVILLGLLLSGVPGCGAPSSAENTNPLPTNRFPPIRTVATQR
jgi:hypothetical protein